MFLLELTLLCDIDLTLHHIFCIQMLLYAATITVYLNYGLFRAHYCGDAMAKCCLACEHHFIAI